jgi:sialidase-1
MRVLVLCLLALTGPLPALDLYTGTGQSPRHTYRIPTLAVTKEGTILAFAERRVNGKGDTGDIDTVVKRSTDGGMIWSDEITVADIGTDTIGNACPTVDPESGAITVIMTWNRLPEKKVAPGFGEDSRLVYLTRSTDDGRTWSEPENITRQVKQADWGWFASGPGSGIVLELGTHKGRFVLGVNHKDAEGYRAHVIYSDDRGKTWKSSKSFAALHTNECEVAELEDGSLMLNMRNHGSPKKERAIAISKDGGETWGETTWDANLPEPQCMGTLKRHSWARDGKPGLLFFMNPASQEARKDLILRGSYDDGETWAGKTLIKSGDAAYSHLAIMPDGRIALAYETDGYGKIVFEKVAAGSRQ